MRANISTPEAGSHPAPYRQRIFVAVTLVILIAPGLGGCVAQPTIAQPVAQSRAEAAPSPVQVFVYPTQGQSETALDRDRYECHLWAVKQTGYDPSEPLLAPHQHVEVVAMPPPGSGTVAGAVTGAILGAAVSRPHQAGGGAVAGAVVGAMIGAASDAARQEQAARVQQGYDQREAAITARFERQASDYRRAISACLEGRGYTVK